jgi:putative peptidoglycan lipid II flippase
VLIGRVLASLLPGGQLSYLAYANRFATFLLVFAGSGIATAVFPRFALHSAKSNTSGLSDEFNRAIGYMAFVIIAFLVPAVCLRSDLIRIALQHGQFRTAATTGTAAALLGYAGAVYANALAGLCSNALYSLQRTATVVGVGISGLVIYIGAAVLLIDRVGYVGVAYAASLTALVNLAVYSVVLRRSAVRVDVRGIAVLHARLVPTAAAAWAAAALCRWLLGPSIGAVALAGVAGLVAFVLAAWFMRCPQSGDIVRSLRRIAGRARVGGATESTGGAA